MCHLKNRKSLLQPCLAILEQCAHLTLTKKVLDFAPILLGFNKCMDFMKGPNSSGQAEVVATRQPTYSVNFPI
jgi:hypothetical protein